MAQVKDTNIATHQSQGDSSSANLEQETISENDEFNREAELQENAPDLPTALQQVPEEIVEALEILRNDESSPESSNVAFEKVKEYLQNNPGNQKVLTELLPASDTPLWEIREKVVSLLAKHGKAEPLNAFVDKLADKLLDPVWGPPSLEILKRLAPQTVEQIIAKITDADRDLMNQIKLIEVVPFMGDAAFDPLKKVILNQALDLESRVTGLWALGAIENPAAKEVYQELLEDKASILRTHSAMGLAKLGDLSSMNELRTQALRTVMDSENPHEEYDALDTLSRFIGMKEGYAETFSEIAERASDPSLREETRAEFVMLVGRFPSQDQQEEATKLIRTFLQDPAPTIRVAAAVALEQAGAPDALEVLGRLSSDQKLDEYSRKFLRRRYLRLGLATDPEQFVHEAKTTEEHELLIRELSRVYREPNPPKLAQVQRALRDYLTTETVPLEIQTAAVVQLIDQPYLDRQKILLENPALLMHALGDESWIQVRRDVSSMLRWSENYERFLEVLEQQDNVESMEVSPPEYAKALRAAREFGITRPFRFPPEDLVRLMDNRRDNKPDDRPLAIITMPRYDPENTSFAFSSEIGKLLDDGYYRVLLHEPGSDPEFFSQLRELTGRDVPDRAQKASLWVPIIHGSQDSMQLSWGTSEQEKSKENLIDLTDLEKMEKVADCFQEGVVIPMVSCSTGAGGKNDTNLANMVAQALREKNPSISAPRIDALALTTSLEFGKDGEVIGLKESRILPVYRPSTQPAKEEQK